jgi:ribose transport system permease protein
MTGLKDVPAASAPTAFDLPSAVADVSLARTIGTRTRPYALVVALAATVILFSVLKPAIFPTTANVQTMLRQMVPLAIPAFGLTVVLVMNDFDLSLGAMMGLGGTTAVVSMSSGHLQPAAAIVVALAMAVAVGVANGLAIALAGASSFVITLAAGTILQGIEYKLSNQRPVFQGIPSAYQKIADGRLFGLSYQVYIALAVFLVIFVLLETSELGRYMYAIGSNPEAARLSGLRVRSLRMLGFVIMAICSTISGILLTSQAGQSTPDVGIPYLLPVFAAAFLGSTAVRVGRFNIVGTLIGALFLQVISTGLVLLQLKPAYVNIVQGGILAGSVLLARLGSEGRRA